MSSISKTGPLVEILEVHSLRSKTVGESAQKVEGKKKRKPGALGAWAADYVIKRIAMIDADDPKREQKAYRAFLEGTLVCLTGRSDVAEAGFQAVVDRVHQTLQDDVELGHTSRSIAQKILGGEITVVSLQKLFEEQARASRSPVSG